MLPSSVLRLFSIGWCHPALLGWMAFLQPVGGDFDGVGVSTTLEVKGNINVDPPIPVKADREGVVNHFVVRLGDDILEGSAQLRIRTEGQAEPVQESNRESEAEDGDPTDGESAAPEIPKYHTVIASEDGTGSGCSKSDLGLARSRSARILTTSRSATAWVCP